MKGKKSLKSTVSYTAKQKRQTLKTIQAFFAKSLEWTQGMINVWLKYDWKSSGEMGLSETPLLILREGFISLVELLTQ